MTTKLLQIEYVSPSRLSANPWNTNKVGPEGEGKLENSILEFQIYKPIIVRERDDGALEILGGEHRWRAAIRLGHETIPIINLGPMPDIKAKALGLADNGQYGEDDGLKLAELLAELSADGSMMDLLPYTDEDLAGIMAATKIDLDNLGFDESDEATHGLPDPADIPARPAITHELMRFKVPVEDRERVEKLVQRVIKDHGLAAESDSLIAAGMALVILASAAKDHV